MGQISMDPGVTSMASILKSAQYMQGATLMRLLDVVSKVATAQVQPLVNIAEAGHIDIYA